MRAWKARVLPTTPRPRGVDCRRGSADPEAEVRRVDAARFAPAARRADREADADLTEVPVEDVRAVARAVHPGVHDRLRRARVAQPPGDVLAVRPLGEAVGQVPDPLEPCVEAGLAAALVV